MKKYFTIPVLTLSIAIFSMFFGAGNIVFPLKLGMAYPGSYLWAFLGFMLTAIGGPLLGLLSATLLEGKCKKFFYIAGRPIGLFLMISTLAMVIFIGMPRCLTISYSALNPLFPVSLGWFAVFFTAIALLCCWKHRYVLPVLGKFLSPLLLICLFAIIVKGLFYPVSFQTSISPSTAFWGGFSNGYYTMDLIASIYFSAGIWTLIKVNFKSDTASTFRIALVSGIIGCAFLALIYLGLCRCAACFHTELAGVAPEYLLTTLANTILGSKLTVIANAAVALACLTTVISLAMALSDIICLELVNKRISYHTLVFLTLVSMGVMSQFGFMGLMTILHPIISVCYPVIILLVFINIWQKFRRKSLALS